MSGPASGFKDRYGSWAVIAGGSDGIGGSFAHQVAAEGLANLGKGPFWIAGEVNREAAGLFLSPDRVPAIEAMSMGAAVMRGLEYRPVTSRE